MPDITIQRQMAPEEHKEEEVQTKPLATAITPLVQREAMPDKEVQTKPIPASIQREIYRRRGSTYGGNSLYS